MNHANELLKHLLGDGEVGNHTVFHRANSFNVARHLTQHLLSFFTYGLNILFGIGTALLANRYHGGLIQNDPQSANINQGIGCTQINGEIVRKIATEESKHVIVSLCAGI